MSIVKTLATIIGSALGGLLGVWHEHGGAAPVAFTACQQVPPVDRAAWAQKLTGLNEANWRTAFEVGQELAALPGEAGFAILQANWERIGKVEARRQLLKAWFFASPLPLHIRPHPRLLDGLNLGMHDRSPVVQSTAISYLSVLSLQDFSEDFQAYEAWYQANRDKPVHEVVAETARRFAAEAARSGRQAAPKRAPWLSTLGMLLGDMPEARQAALDAGLMRSLSRWAAAAEGGAPPEEIVLSVQALRAIGLLKPGEAELRRIVVPLLGREKPSAVRAAAIGALGGKENAWAVDLLLDVLKEGFVDDERNTRETVWAAARTLVSIGDPKVIPPMIAIVGKSEPTDMMCDVSNSVLRNLTGVRLNGSRDGTWWRRWWEENKERYPEAVRSLEITNLSREQKLHERAPADPRTNIETTQAQDLRAGGDEKKRYFLIGAKNDRPPATGYRLLIVLPGGEGGADNQPFIHEIHKNVLNNSWLIAQAVAPKWDDNQFNRVVWPTAAQRYPKAKFTTEEFIRAIVDDVRSRVKIDRRRVILLGWSSGGPPCYATALHSDSGVTGAFIAMSVFRPGELPALENAKGKAFYLLQSPQDPITPVQHAEAAMKRLHAAGALVRLRRYEGGHGWHGDAWRLIGDGIAWLEEQGQSSIISSSSGRATSSEPQVKQGEEKRVP